MLKTGQIELEIGRAPPGARGLKLVFTLRIQFNETSRSARGAWIETGPM